MGNNLHEIMGLDKIKQSSEAVKELNELGYLGRAMFVAMLEKNTPQMCQESVIACGEKLNDVMEETLQCSHAGIFQLGVTSTWQRFLHLKKYPLRGSMSEEDIAMFGLFSLLYGLTHNEKGELL